MPVRRARSFSIPVGSTSVFVLALSRHSRTTGQGAKSLVPKSRARLRYTSSSMSNPRLESILHPSSLRRTTLPRPLKSPRSRPSPTLQHSQPWVLLSPLCPHRLRVRMVTPSMHTRCTLPLAVYNPLLRPRLSHGKPPTPSHHSRPTWPLLRLRQLCFLVLHNPIGMVRGSPVSSNPHPTWWLDRVALPILIDTETNKRIGRLRLRVITHMIPQRSVWQPNHATWVDVSVQYEQPYDQAPPYIHDPGPSTAASSTAPVDNSNGEKSRGRKRSRTQASLQSNCVLYLSENLAGNSCCATLYPCSQSKESTRSVPYATKSRNQEHIWRKSFHLGRCVVPQEIHRLLSGARPCTKVCVSLISYL